ncbi:MAG: hypothetical protein GC166_03085 [Alphaproteobacteria bacterium]|nr:hypothetical protein [Alphaproteobacteria bacterium]
MAAKTHRTVWPLFSEPRSVALILTIYCALHLILRLGLSPNYVSGEAVQVLFAQSARWGYRAGDPPLATWLSWIILQATGNSRAAFFLIEYAVMGTGLVAFFAAARMVLGDVKAAAMAALAPIATATAGYFAHMGDVVSVVSTAMFAIFLWSALRVFTHGKAIDYLFPGLSMGLGFLSGPSFLVLPVAMIVALLFVPSLMAHIRPVPIAGSALLALLIAIPHLRWLSLQEGGLWSGLVTPQQNTLIVVLCALFPLLAIAPVLYARALSASRASEIDLIWLRFFSVAAAVSVLLNVCLYAAGMLPPPLMAAVMTLTLWFFMRVKLAAFSDRAHQLFAGIVFALALASIGWQTYAYQSGAYACRECSAYWYMPAYVRGLRNAGFNEGTIVADTVALGGNLRTVFPASRIVTPDAEPSTFGLPKNGQCLIVWEGRGEVPPAMSVYLRADLSANISPAAPRGTIDARLLKSDGRFAAVRYILLPGSGACD